MTGRRRRLDLRNILGVPARVVAPPEAALVRRVNALFTRMARTEPFWSYKSYGTRFARAGVADYLVCYAGRFGALELKRKGEVPTSLQERDLAWVARAGGIASWADDFEGVQDFVRQLKG